MFFVSTSDARPEQLVHLVQRDVGPDRLLERGDQFGQLRDEVLRVGLLAQRQEDALLALASVEVGRRVTRAGVLEGLGAVHVLDAGRDVQPVELAPFAREAIVRDRDLDVDRDAADRVDDLLEAFEVDFDEVLDVEVVQLAEDRLQARCSRASGRCRTTGPSGDGCWRRSC